MKKIIGSLILGSVAFAQPQYNFLLSDDLGYVYNKPLVIPTKPTKPKTPPSTAYYTSLFYAGNISYDNSNKDSGYVGGVYLSIFDSPFKTEMDIEQTSISYNDGSPDLTQLDSTIVVHYYEGYNLDYKLGFHYIDSTDDVTDAGVIVIGGILYYKTLDYNYGLDIYYSNYSNLDTSPTILQVSPKVGYNFGNYYSFLGSFYFEAQADYIDILNNALANNLSNSYFSTAYNLSNYNGNWTTTIGFWEGKRAFGIENGGFIVNNLSDVQTGGFKFSESYKVDKISSIKFSYAYNKEITGSKSKVYLLSYNYNF